MSNISWNKVEEIIDQALELPIGERKQFIKNECGANTQLEEEVTLFLDSIADSVGWLEDPGNYKKELYEEVSKDLEVLSTDQFLIGKRVGSYVIKKEIGQGGMGMVFMAERADKTFEHRVAIKIIRRGHATEQNIQRFKREQRILAGLNHPGIAQLFDGGVTEDGFPYIIMEYVAGTPLDEYCQTHGCSVEQKISLFQLVLEAVGYAHENLVIHRDLKPSNIFVDDSGNIKILDFGISKLLEEDNDTSLTQTGARLLTPRYAAPEQIRQQNITTATDLYALGMVLYELLTGTNPYQLQELSHFETEQEILNTDPPKPSSKASSQKLKKALRGDLDSIVLKSIRKEPDKRYRAANEFRDDLQNLRQGLPVSACEDSLSYRTQKFFNRHKEQVLTAACVLFLLIGFTGFYMWKITQERNETRLEAQKAEKISSFLMDLFQAHNPTESLGDTVKAIDLLQRGVERAEQLKTQPKVQAQMFDVIGQVYRRLGKYKQAQTLLERAVFLRSTVDGIDNSETAASLDHLGLLLTDMGEYEQAINTLRRSLKIRRKAFQDNLLDIARTQAVLAYALRRKGNYKQSEKIYKQSLAIQQEKLGAEDPLTIETKSNLGATLHNQGKYKEAEKVYREVLQQRRKVLGHSHPDVAMSINNLAALLMNMGNFSESQKLLNEALALRKKLFGDHHPKVALTMNNLAIVLSNQGQYERAENIFRSVLEMRIQQMGDKGISTSITRFCLAGLFLDTDRPDSALVVYQKVLPVFEEKLSSMHSFTIRTRMGIGSAYLAMGQLSKARQLIDEGFNNIQKIHPPGSLEWALAEIQMGTLLLKEKEYKKAASLLTHSYNSLKNIQVETSLRQQQILALLNKINQKNSKNTTQPSL